MPTPLDELRGGSTQTEPATDMQTPLMELRKSAGVDTITQLTLPRNDIGKTPLELLRGNRYGASDSAVASGMSNTLGPDSALFPTEHRKSWEGGIVSNIFDTLQFPFRLANTVIAPIFIPRLRYGDNAVNEVLNNPEFNYRDELIKQNPEALKTWWGRGIARTAGLAMDLGTDPLMYAFGPIVEGLGAIQKLGTVGRVVGTTGKLVIDPLGTTWKAAYEGSKAVPYLKDVTLGYEARHAIGEDLRKWFGQSTITEGLTTRETNKILPEFKKKFYDASLKDGKSLGKTGKDLRDYANDKSLNWFIEYMGANIDKPSEGIQQVWKTGKEAFLQSETESKFEAKLGGTMVSRLKGMATSIEKEHDLLGSRIVGQTGKLDSLLNPNGPFAPGEASSLGWNLARSGELSDTMGHLAQPTALAGAIGEKQGLREAAQRFMSPYYAVRKRITALERLRGTLETEFRGADASYQNAIDSYLEKDISANPNIQDEILKTADEAIRKGSPEKGLPGHYPLSDGLIDNSRIAVEDSAFTDMVQGEATNQFEIAAKDLPYTFRPEMSFAERGRLVQGSESASEFAKSQIQKNINGINAKLAGHNVELDGLGKSIDRLLVKRSQNSRTIKSTVRNIGIDSLFSVEDPIDSELMKTSRVKGILSPVVAIDQGNGSFKVIDGGHRLAAAKNTGIKSLKVSVITPEEDRIMWDSGVTDAEHRALLAHALTGSKSGMASTGKVLTNEDKIVLNKLKELRANPASVQSSIDRTVETGGMRGSDIPDATKTLENFRELRKIDTTIRDQRITEGRLKATINQSSRDQARKARHYAKVVDRQATYEEMRSAAQDRLNDVARLTQNNQVLTDAGQTAARVVRDKLLADIQRENPGFPMEEVNKLWKEYADYDTVLRTKLVEAGAMTQLTSDKWAGFHVSRIYDVIENPEEAANFFMDYDPVKAGEILSKAANGGRSIRSVNPAAIGKKRLNMTDEERAALLEIKNPFARLLKTRTREGRSIGMNKAFREIFDKYALNTEDAGLQNYLFHANPKDPFKWLVDNGLTQAEADRVMVQNGGRPRWYAQMPSTEKGTITKFPWNDNKFLSKPLSVTGPITPESVGNAERAGQGRYGVLSGQWVPQEVHSLLHDRFRALGDSDNLFFKAMSTWKAGMTIDNPAGQIRNHVANLMRILHHTGMEPIEASYRIGKAMQDIKTGGPAFERYLRADPSAHESTMWVGNEFQRLTHEYKPEDGAIGYLKDLGSKTQRVAGGVFQYIEQIGKLATFMKFMDTHGDEYAGKMASETLFNYQEVPYWVRKARKGWVPFLTYPYKAIPAEIHDIVFNTKNYALERHLYEAVSGYNIEGNAKRREEERTMPDYVDPSMALRLPFTDESGKSRYLDTKYIMPLGTVAFDSGGAKTGLDALKQGLGMLNPLLKSLYEVGANKQLYNDQPVTNEMDPNAIVADDLKYLINQAMPPIAPSVGGVGGRSVKQIRDAFSETTNMQGEASSKTFTLLGATGFKTVPIDVESNRMKIDAKIKRIESNASLLTNRSYNDYYMGKIDENEMSNEVDRIRNYEMAAIEKELAK